MSLGKLSYKRVLQTKQSRLLVKWPVEMDRKAKALSIKGWTIAKELGSKRNLEAKENSTRVWTPC
jgi:hypothetical protein